MSKKSKRIVAAVLTLWLLAVTCNLPAGTAQPVKFSDEDIANTAVARILSSQPAAAPDAAIQTSTPIPPTATLNPTATQCQPMVVATTDVNVRNGPGSVYDIIGALPTGATAPLAGRNDAGSWWYIAFPGGVNGYAWVSASYATAACAPQVIQVVAAPPTPTSPPPTNTEKVTIPPLLIVTLHVPPLTLVKPDLYVSEYSWSPSPPHMGVSFHVRIGAYNQGNAAAGAFKVQWWLSTSAPSPTCTWNVASMAAHGGRILECDYTPGGWANYPSRVIVDSGNAVAESNEGNNTLDKTLSIKP